MRSLDESCTLHGPLARGKADRPATEGSLLETARARGCKPFASPSVTVRGAQGGSDGVRMVLSRNSRRVSPPWRLFVELLAFGLGPAAVLPTQGAGSLASHRPVGLVPTHTLLRSQRIQMLRRSARCSCAHAR